jgi:hypothetical protein
MNLKIQQIKNLAQISSYFLPLRTQTTISITSFTKVLDLYSLSLQVGGTELTCEFSGP